jgi:AmmeMemoRadiSam system protein A
MLQLSNSQKKLLLDIARQSVTARLAGESLDLGEAALGGFEEKFGVFVSIHKHGELRGCIGRVESDDALGVVTAECAASAAFADPRFVPLTIDELDVVTFEVSVLSPLERVEAPEAIEVGQHGLVIEKDGRRGLLLPQVASQYGWDRTEFLRQTSIKAGLDPDAWRSGAELYMFRSAVFEEGAT